MQSYYWVAGVDVIAPPDAATLVTFGDSITDGDQSTPDTERHVAGAAVGAAAGDAADVAAWAW